MGRKRNSNFVGSLQGKTLRGSLLLVARGKKGYETQNENGPSSSGGGDVLQYF